MRHVAFKFFLWDQLRDSYDSDAARPDRIKIFTLKWRVDETETMLTERMKSFSERGVVSFNEIVVFKFNCHKLVSYIAQGSPRDLIRVCGHVIDEQVRTGAMKGKIEAEKFWDGVERFCGERSNELFPKQIADLRRIGRLTFTNRYLANDVFRVSENAIRPRIQGWQNVGAVSRIGEVPNPGNRPLYLYGISDIRLATEILPNVDAEMVFGNFLLLFPNCGSVNISDQDGFTCECGTRTSLDACKSIYQVCDLGG